jgi:hypothetical protein
MRAAFDTAFDWGIWNLGGTQKGLIPMVQKRHIEPPVQWLALFSSPPLLPGEDQKLYQKVSDRIFADVKPVDTIEKILVGDFVHVLWDLWRWRRLLSSFMKVKGRAELQNFIASALEYDDVVKEYEDALAETLQDLVPEDQQQEDARTLAHKFALNDAGADEKVKEYLFEAGLYHHLDDIIEQAKAEKAKQLVQAYARSEPKAVKQVNELVLASGSTLDDFTSQALVNGDRDFAVLRIIERLERLIANAESRRNAILREIDRHRAPLCDALRRQTIPQIEAEVQVVETKPVKDENGREQRSKN